MRSRTKWASFSFRYLSCSRLGPLGPTVSECSSLGAGLPALVVVRVRFCSRWSLIYFSSLEWFFDAQRRRRERKNKCFDHPHFANKFTAPTARGAHSRASDAVLRRDSHPHV